MPSRPPSPHGSHRSHSGAVARGRGRRLPLAGALLLGAVVCATSAWAPGALAQRGKKDVASEKAPVVAVLPFKTLNKEDAYQHYGEGASDAIINRIVNDKALRVVEESNLDKAVARLARNQTGLFSEDSALAVGQMVDARFIVVGSVQLVGDEKTGQIKVNARVLEVESRQLLVSESVFGPVAAAFQQYDEIASRLVNKMTTHLSQRVNSGASADAIAVAALIEEGKAFDPAFPMRGNTPKDLQKAIGAYNKAVLRDPKSARAQLALGHGEMRLSETLDKGDPARAKQILAAARSRLAESTRLDDGNVFAWTQLGRAEGRLGNHSAARQAFEQALARDGNHVDARLGLAVALLHGQELEAARQEAAQAKAQGDARADGLLRQIDTALALQKEKQPAAAQR
jgi:TolB-like protein